jgi:hypothetical protein
MRTVAIPWAALMIWQAYARSAVRNQQGNVIGRKLPEPYNFIWGSALMAAFGIIADAYETLGALLAWGTLLAAVTAYYRPKANPLPASAPTANVK